MLASIERGIDCLGRVCWYACMDKAQPLLVSPTDDPPPSSSTEDLRWYASFEILPSSSRRHRDVHYSLVAASFFVTLSQKTLFPTHITRPSHMSATSKGRPLKFRERGRCGLLAVRVWDLVAFLSILLDWGT